MRYAVIVIFICINLSAVAQKNYKDHILIYKTINSTDDTVLVGNSMYCFIDSANFIHWSSEPFRTNDYGAGTIDTVKYQDTFKLSVNEVYIPHRITSIYRFNIQYNQIWVTEKNPNGEDIHIPYLDLSFKILKPDFDFFNGSDKKIELYHHKSYFVKTKLLSRDTIFVINDRIFHCWKFEAYLNEISDQQYSVYCIDKKSLLPICFEIYDAIETHSLIKTNDKKTTFHLFGIVELNRKLLKGLHIWDDHHL